MPRRQPPLSADAIPIAATIHAALLKSPYNPTSASTEAGLGKTYVRDILTGRSRNPKSEEIEKLAKILDFEVPASAEPGVLGSDEVVGQSSDHFGELAVMGLWGLVTDAARWLVFLEVWRNASPADKEAAVRRLIELARERRIPPAEPAPVPRGEGEDV